MNFYPLNDCVIVVRDEKETKTASGILLIDNAEDTNIGKIIAVGLGKKIKNGSRLSPFVKIGDRVLFEKHAGQTIQIDRVNYLMMREDSILAIIENE